MNFWSRLEDSFKKVKTAFHQRLSQTLGMKRRLTPELLERLEELLIEIDLGLPTTQKIIKNLEEKVRKEGILEEDIYQLLKLEILKILGQEVVSLNFHQGGLNVVLVLGVNGVGKTTTVGKLAWRLKENGHRVLLSCADTFRAAASEQLEIWGKRVGVEVVRSQLHADPAAVVFDALTAAFHRKVDFLLVDTAGRFHHRQNLIEEAKKIKKIIKKRYPPAPQETLLVIDATTGQNALEQVRTFHQELEITGVVLTKLDGTAKGGTVVAIRDIIGVPIKLVGLGEEKTALKNFDPVLFTEALF